MSYHFVVILNTPGSFKLDYRCRALEGRHASAGAPLAPRLSEGMVGQGDSDLVQLGSFLGQTKTAVPLAETAVILNLHLPKMGPLGFEPRTQRL